MKRLYKVIFEDRTDVYREFIPADSKEAAESYVAGNGDILCTTDVTEDFPISLSFLAKTLSAAEYGKAEIDAILRLVQAYENTF